MTQDQITAGTSRNTSTISARQRRMARQGGISFIAMAAMLGAAPASAKPANYAQVNLNIVPTSSYASGFVTSGSQQQNTAAAVAAAINGATASSTVTGNSAAPLPSTTTVTGNKLAAYATGNAQTNGVDLATIGSSDTANGIAVLAEQSNIYANYLGAPPYTIPTTINSAVTDSALLNQFTNATDGDALSASNNLIAGQATGNIAVSSVTGVVPVTYTDEATPGAITAGGSSGAAQGNIVVGTGQINDGAQNGVGSFSTLSGNDIGLLVDSTSGLEGQYLALSTSQIGNVASSDFLGNSANNDIGVSLTAGTLTGAPTLYGSLVVTNQQFNLAGDTFGNTPGTGAVNTGTSIYTSITQNGDDNEPITLDGGSTTQNNNVISASAIGNSATGATASAPGNEITLGINLVGDTTTQNNASDGEDINLLTGADLALSNLQVQGETEVSASSVDGNIGTYVQNVIGSSIGVVGNAITSNVADNLASNAIDTATGVGINLISGLTALNSEQLAYGATATATTQFDSIGARAEGYNGEDTGGVTNSTVSVSGNSLTATSNINQATNSIALAASTINAGILGAASDPAGAFAATDDPSGVGAGISLNNNQVAESLSTANVGPSYISAYAGGAYLSNDSVSVINPVFASSATTNQAANSITLAGSQSVTGAVGLQSTQLQFGPGTFAFGEDNEAEVSLLSGGEDNDITGVSGVLSATSMSADATDNYASNTLAVSGGQLSDITGGEDALSAQSGGGPFDASEVIADLALNNLQNDLGAPAYSYEGEDTLSVAADADGGGIANSAFTVSGPAANAPTVQALAIGNEAQNALSATASTVLSDTAGLVNAQENSTGAGAIGEDTIIAANVNTNDGTGDISGSSITVGSGAVGGSNGNIARVLTYDNQASNTLTASAGTIDLVAGIDDLQGSVISLDPPSDTFLGEDGTGVAAAYGLLNDQVAYGEDFAAGEDTEIGAFLGNTANNPAVTDVTASTAGNALVSSVFANQADSSATLAAGNLSADGYYPAADVTNVQVAYSNPEATLDDTDTEAFTTQVLGDGQVTASTLDVNGNTALTQAEANQASNSLDTTGGNIIDTSFDPALTGLSVDTGMADIANANLAFTVQNVQNSQGTLTSQQTSTNALLSAGGAVDLSTLTAANNIFESTAYSNNAANSLAFGTADSPVNSLDTSAGVQNVQTAASAMTVTLGAPAVPGTPAIPGYSGGTFSVSSSVLSSGTWTGSGTGLTVATGTVTLNFASAADATAFAGNIASGTYTHTANSTTITVPVGSLTFDHTIGSYQNWDYTLAGMNSTAQGTFSTAGTAAVPGTPASPSVVISAAGPVTASTLAVIGNAFDATAIANAAVNTAVIAATTINGGSGIAAGTANANVSGTVTAALADYAVSNVQGVTAPVSAETNGEVAINPNGGGAITDSTLSVSNNTQLAKAEGNIATNTLSLAATTAADGEDTVSPTAALVSNQSGTASISASSGSVGEGTTIGDTVTAPGAITGSTLTMDNNTTTVLAIVNNVTNLLSASATILDTADTTLTNASAAYSASNPTSTADYALTNVQSATGGTVTATAVTTVINADSTATTTTGLVNSAVDISGNITTADATASTASNTLDLSATDTTATGALTNSQDSSDAVTATGLTTTGFALNGGATAEDAAASASTVAVNGNSQNEQAIGNQATNALNATTGASYGSQLGAVSEDDSATATYAVLNRQDNSGAVTATGSSGSQYAVALNSGGATTPVGATTINVTYNTMDAAAYGNSANNSATVSALNSGNATVALQNQQLNTGAVSASITGSTIGASVGSPGISGATMAVGNNSIVSSAIGNTATNMITH
jgi:hypothetical protein